MSDFGLPDPQEAAPAKSSGFDLPEGLEPNVNEINNGPKSKKWIWIVVIALLVLVCCCCVVMAAMFFSADSVDFNNILNEFSFLLP